MNGIEIIPEEIKSCTFVPHSQTSEIKRKRENRESRWRLNNALYTEKQLL